MVRYVDQVYTQRISTRYIKLVKITLRIMSDKGSKVLKQMHNRSRLTKLNQHLDDTEVAIMDMMRLGNESTFESVHALIGERENTKYKLKDLHKKIYG
jgi:hypothetical protein